ncbi:MAG: hypothetical protein HKO54_00790, partial [Flavobacteriaceae bacterium]|nr:hypothetical protein [Flavobacteriaceae bacterium]
TGMTAQKANKQVAEEVMMKNYTINHGDMVIDYTIKVKTKESGYVTMQKQDLTKEEQDRVRDEFKVTKLISIDNDVDPFYDNILELTYVTKADDHFEVVQTNEGFEIKVVGQKLKYNFLKKEYDVMKKETDTFDVIVVETK